MKMLISGHADVNGSRPGQFLDKFGKMMSEDCDWSVRPLPNHR